MIELKTGDIFETNTEYIVNPVNTVGYMGKGLAKEFAKRHPEILPIYKKKTECYRKYGKRRLKLVECYTSASTRQLKIGYLYTHKLKKKTGKYGYVVMFPTKMHFKNKSKLVYIRDGLLYLNKYSYNTAIPSISLPLLGCGLGGLNKKTVLKMMIGILSKANIPRVVIYIDDDLLDYGNGVINSKK